MSQQMMVFVSHAHEDDVFCRAVVSGLRRAGADVWYDEHNLGSGQLMAVIQRELGGRPVVVVILSKAAFASTWVHREVTWAYELLDRDHSRVILPVTGGPIERADFDPSQGWLFLHDFKRIEAAGMQPYPVQEAVRRLLHDLALTPAGEAPAPPAPLQSTDSVEDLLARGKALQAQGKVAEALPLFERATQLAPRSFDAWYNLGLTLTTLKRPAQERLDAFERTCALRPNNANAWTAKGHTLLDLKRDEEALAAFERATTLDPANVAAWNNKGLALCDLTRYEEALTAFERATTLDPTSATAWTGVGGALRLLKRPAEALAAYERATILDPADAIAWANKGFALTELGCYQEALAALDEAIRLGGDTEPRWRNKATALRGLRRNAEATAAERRAKELRGQPASSSDA